MNTLTWVIQANMRDRGHRQRIEAALDALGESHHAVAVAPFSREEEGSDTTCTTCVDKRLQRPSYPHNWWKLCLTPFVFDLRNAIDSGLFKFNLTTRDTH